ncbi:acetate kinase [candidate division KSB1 bacterium]|nr:acetate kinase [candidate division KSB1 bacterium]
MKILVLNCGSSSVKYQLLDPEKQFALAKGLVSRIGMSGAVLSHQRFDSDEIKMTGEILDHTAAIEYVLAILLSANHGVIKDSSEISAIGHRVVHGGEKFKSSVLITSDVVRMIRECFELAPLHNPHNMSGINACFNILPGVPQVAVFDTAFHSQMPEMAYIYGLPYVLYKRYGIRRYGFHGTSHYYVSRQAYQLLNLPREKCKIITCHLGNGCSIAAIDHGISVDTSMGFTPLEGLLMGTRSGDLDPSVILHIMGREEIGSSEANSLLNKHSGLIGISGESSDMRDIIDGMKKGNPRSKLAFDIFCYRLKKYIASYAGAMGGLNAVVFTGGIGENSAPVRASSVQGLEFMGIKLDPIKNQQLKSGVEMDISAPDASVKTFVIPTNEELVIAIDTMKIIQGESVNF